MLLTSTHLQLLALSQTIHIFCILARATVSIEGAVAALGAHIKNRLLLNHCGDKSIEAKWNMQKRTNSDRKFYDRVRNDNAK